MNISGISVEVSLMLQDIIHLTTEIFIEVLILNFNIVFNCINLDYEERFKIIHFSRFQKKS